MFHSQSQFSTFGWWVAWVYLLSLAAILVAPPIEPLPALPSIAFAETSIVVTEKDGTVIEEVTATVRLSKPAEARLPVSIEYVEETARQESDFEVQGSGRSICFEPGEQEKVLRFGRPVASGKGRDVTIVGPTTKPAKDEVVGEPEGRSFRVQLEGNNALEPVGDDGSLLVTIHRADRLKPRQPRASFAGPAVEAVEKELPGLPIAVRFDRPLPEPATVEVSLFRIDGDHEEKIEAVTQSVARGEEGLSLTLGTLFSSRALEEHRVVDDRFPEADEHYRLKVMSSDVYPVGALDLTALNDDGDELRVRTVSADGGRAIEVVDDGPDWIDAADRWWRLGATLPDGERIDLGPTRPGNRVRLPDEVYEKWKGRCISYDVTHCDPPAGQGRCRKSGCKVCRGGGCPEGQRGTGKCGAGRALCGPAVPGDYLLVVVNNERLHEPGDTIVDRVREALADDAAKPYGNGAIIVNPQDEDSMTAEGGVPSKDKMFQPFERAGEDVAAQQKRVEEVIAKKRESAQRPDLRAVVIWPERDLASGAGLGPVVGEQQQPVSFLFPGADPSYARNMRPLVPPKARPGAVTIRSPKEEELTDHILNVVREAAAAAPGTPPSSEGEAPPPRDVEDAVDRATG